MIITVQSRDTGILENIVNTLSQIKDGAVANYPLPLNHTAANCTVSFFVDEGKTQLLFTETTQANPSSFSVQNTKTLYTPPDAKINDAAGLSTTLAQGIYWVTATFSDSTAINTTYRNVDNLVFQSVVVSSKDKPDFTTTENTAVIVPRGQKTAVRPTNDDLIYIQPEFMIYLQLNVLNWRGLSEQARASQGQTVNNLIRSALYTDPTRGNNCTFFSKDLYGTNVDSLKLLPSTDLLRACIKVQTCYVTSSAQN